LTIIPVFNPERERPSEGGMAPVPAWTKTEWRPLATDLCGLFLRKASDRVTRRGGVIGGGGGVEDESMDESEGEDEEGGDEADGIDDVDGGEALLLRADRVVGQLYMNGFMDCTPQQVDKQARALATKFRVHSLDERAEKLLQLASRVDYQALKMLMELAVRPTAASDEAVTVDYEREGVGNWMEKARGDQDAKEAEQEALRNQLIDELVEISTNDEWYQEWEDTSDEEDGDMDDSDDQRPAWPVETSFAQFRRPKRPSTAMEDNGAHPTNSKELLDTSLDELVDSAKTAHESRRLSVHDDQLTDEDLHDLLVRRNFPLVDLSGGNSLNNDTALDSDSITIDLEGDCVAFAMDRPWMLCHTVVADAAKPNDAIQINLLHEQTCVNMVFRALEGAESDIFELRSCSQPLRLFHVDFHPSEFRLSMAAQAVAVGHLSPSLLQSVLDQFGRVASDLQQLRDIQGFLRATSNGLPASVTIDGLASALSEVIRLVDTTILSVEHECHHPDDGDSPDDCSSSAVSWFERNASRTQLTLLGVHGRLKQVFRVISWLSRTLPTCFETMALREATREVRPAECATVVLSVLYRMLNEEHMEQAHAGLFGEPWARDEGRRTWGWSRYDIFLHLFMGALNPYLALLHQLLFERRGYTPNDSVELPPELFFVSSVSVSQASLGEHSFKVGLSQLAPFDGDVKLVPVFLKPLIGLMKDALASRQMMNRFLSSEQHVGANLDRVSSVKPPLPELFTRDMEHAGWRSLNQFFSSREGGNKGLPWQPRPLDLTPVNQLLQECLISHLQLKV
jgi:hypothetical protein